MQDLTVLKFIVMRNHTTFTTRSWPQLFASQTAQLKGRFPAQLCPRLTLLGLARLQHRCSPGADPTGLCAPCTLPSGAVTSLPPADQSFSPRDSFSPNSQLGNPKPLWTLESSGRGMDTALGHEGQAAVLSPSQDGVNQESEPKSSQTLKTLCLSMVHIMFCSVVW